MSALPPDVALELARLLLRAQKLRRRIFLLEALPVIALVAAGVRAALGLSAADLTLFLTTLVTLVAGSVASLTFARVERKELEDIRRQAAALVS